MGFTKRPNSGRKPSGRSNDRPHSRGPSRSGPKRFRTQCAECGQKCEVPFTPTEGKPVLCGKCFRSNEVDQRKEFELINKKLDMILKSLKD